MVELASEKDNSNSKVRKIRKFENEPRACKRPGAQPAAPIAIFMKQRREIKNKKFILNDKFELNNFFSSDRSNKFFSFLISLLCFVTSLDPNGVCCLSR